MTDAEMVYFNKLQLRYDSLFARTKLLEDALEKIGKLCLHTPASPIWDEVKSTIGENGEKRIT